MELVALVLALAATALLLARDANAIDTDFPDFQHFRNWDGQYVNLKEVELPYYAGDGEYAPLGVAKDWCAADKHCGAIGSGGHDFFWQLNTTTEFDVYFGIEGETGTAPAAMCSIEPGGGNLPDTHWLACTAWELSIVISTCTSSLLMTSAKHASKTLNALDFEFTTAGLTANSLASLTTHTCNSVGSKFTERRVGI
jgi:hypothetical protein